MGETVFEVGVVGQFEAAHRLHGDFGLASNTHGHTYRVEATARGRGLQADGTLCDITILQSAVDATIQLLHYQDLDEVADLAGANTTAEVLSSFFFKRVASALAHTGVTSLAIRLWESPTAFAGCQGDID